MHREPSPDATPPTPKADAPIDAPTDALTSAPTSATTPSAVDRPHSPASIHSVSQPQPGFQPDPQSPHQPVPPYPHEPDVLPPYEPEADESTNPNDFLDNLDAFIAICPDLILPITAIPPAPTWHGTSVPADREARTATDHTNRSSSGSSSGSSTTINDAPGPPSVSPNTFRLCCSIVHHFFTAIASRQDDVVRLFITRGLVSPDVPSVTGETPLLAAVRAGDGTTLCALVELGATVDAYGSTDEADVVGVLHTALAAVVGFFRSITPRDVWHGLLAVLRAVFVGLPQAMWRFLARFGEVSWDVLAKVAGTLGKAVWVLIWCLFAMLLWLPKQGWKILVSCAKVLWAAVEEVLVLLNPKRVG
ncbi:hypothetical protein VdG2_01681 [Verticillium dahliae VDG2]|nr:hypothetical protein VdG2_01681 [Verticillium dahliae VDG2]